ncbi:LysR family transcriptional regulator [Pseudactinotalea sp. Z1732]|uniref:LysR family transcriptional regulator n=1 Tax=Micrococcales TaxID=85006 RepID=UPI003C7B53D6
MNDTVRFWRKVSEVWDLHRLRLLRELQLRGTITAVAETLSYAPSSVSQQLARLEREVGVPLLEQDGRRVRLTPAGTRVARYAAQVIELQEGVQSELAPERPVPETIRLATLETAARALVPYALTTLEKQAAHLRIEASVVPPEFGLSELPTRGFDLAMAEQYPGYTRAHHDQLHRELLGTDTMRLVVPGRSGIQSLSEARNVPWVVEPKGTAAKDWVVQQCRAAGFEPDIRYYSADLSVHIHLIRAGHAVSLLPDLIWTTQPRGVRRISLPGPFYRELFTSVRRAAVNRPAIVTVRAALRGALEAVQRTPPGGAG